MMARQMKDSGVEWIGEIPDDWEIRKLKYLLECPLQYGANESGIEYTENLPRYIRITDIDNNNNLKTVNKLSLTEQMAKGYILNDNDILFARSGATVGKTFLYKSEYGRSAFAGYLIRATIDIQKAIPKFVFYYTLSEGYDLWKKYIFIQSTIQNIGADKYMNIAIPIPSTDKQQKIADFLDEKVGEINSVIAKTKETIEDYKKYKQAIITEAVTKGLNPNVEMKDSKNEYLGKIPAHWIEKQLRFLGTCQNGISKSSEYFGEGYPFVSYGDVYKNITLPEKGSGLIRSSENDRNTYSVRYGDVFFTRTSETIEEVGFASTCLKTIDDATFAGFVIRFRPNNQDELSPEFSKYYFRSDAHRKFFVKEMNLVTRASLSQELLKKLPVLLPPIDEQKKIADFLDVTCFEIEKLIAKKEELLRDLESYKKSLIYEYVTGKKEIQ